MTRAAATAYAISLAREHLGDYVPTADVTLTTSREPTTAMGGGSRLVVTLTVVVDDPDAPVDEVFIGKSGREVSSRDLAVIEARAKAGDAAARAVTRDLDIGIDEHGQPLDRATAEALLAQQIHDCPECQAARARGEVGVSLGGDELRALAFAAELRRIERRKETP